MAAPRSGAGETASERAPTPAASFVATGNREALEARRLAGTPEPLSAIIESSRAFQRAFAEGGDAPRWGAPEPRGGPLPKIIRSSAAAECRAHSACWGLVSAIVEAYNGHHELVLRPDDVWQAIVTQLSFYVNANAEALRDRFVDFKGKKTLVVEMDGTFLTADYAEFARRMVDENVVKNITDPSVADWLLPNFSTTTETDRVAASVTIMSTLQAYFEFVCRLRCGIPKVTLLGIPADWRGLRGKVDRLLEYDLSSRQMTSWHKLLTPVLDEFVASAEGRPAVGFWDCVCSHHGGGSGPSYLSGWVTVFSVFSHKGVWQGNPNPRDTTSPWPYIDFNKLPVGVVSVPVLVDDNGTQYDTQMLAGQFAYEACGEDGVALQPRTDWCMASAGEPKAKPRAYVHGEVRAAA